MKPLDRLLMSTREEKGCIVWTGSTMWSGYGVFSFNGRQRRVHRVSYMLQVGEIPAGMHVLHRCDNRACVKPEHLFLGSHRDNMQDKAKKGRAYSKVTADLVREMRATSGLTQEDIAKRYGITQASVNRIINRKTWRHVE